MIAEPSLLAAPVGQQGTSRARHRAGCRARRVTRGPLPLTTGTTSRRP
jgi:hypothetical protein